MARESSPAFQFYPQDFYSDPKVLLMTPAGRGAYIMLLCQCWTHKALPDDDMSLASLAAMPVKDFRFVAELVKSCFRKNGDGQLIHARLERERKSQRAYRLAKSRAGKLGQAVLKQRRSSGLGSADVLPEAKLSSSSSSSYVRTDHISRAREKKGDGPPVPKKGHHAHRYCGENFCVSHLQHDLLLREMGPTRDEAWLDEAYRRWDGENPAISNLLPWLKSRINEGRARSQKAVAPQEAGWHCPHTPRCPTRTSCVLRLDREDQTR